MLALASKDEDDDDGGSGMLQPLGAKWSDNLILELHHGPLSRAILNKWPKWSSENHIRNMMDITRDQLQELTEVIEDTVQYACDQHMLSGELAWTVVNCLAVSKLAELEGLVKAQWQHA